MCAWLFVIIAIKTEWDGKQMNCWFSLGDNLVRTGAELTY